MGKYKELTIYMQNQLKKDGILFIIWGWLMFYVNITGYIERSVLVKHQIEKLINILGIVVAIVVMSITLLYFLNRKRDVRNSISLSILYVWVSMLGALVLINLIQNNVLHSINFELQHPIFMVVIGFAIIVTGNILRISFFTFGGILFGMLGLLASYFPLTMQLFLEAVGWLFAIILPGHLLFAKIIKRKEVSTQA